MVLVGYARTCSDDQMLDVQRAALVAAGCERVFEDATSGSGDRSGLREALTSLRAGDTLVVWRLERFGRSLSDLIAQAEKLRRREVGLRTIKESIDTRASASHPVACVFRALAEFERDLVRERAKVRLSAARARGKLGGRRKQLDKEERVRAVALYHSRQHTVKEICAKVGVSRSTLYSYIQELSED